VRIAPDLRPVIDVLAKVHHLTPAQIVPAAERLALAIALAPRCGVPVEAMMRIVADFEIPAPARALRFGLGVWAGFIVREHDRLSKGQL
jgi:hypothetical protein